MAAQKKNDVVIEDGTVYVLRSGTSMYVKTADICAMTGKSNQWIGQLVGQGTINKKSTPHGTMFDVVGTMRAYCSMLEDRANSVEKKETDATEKEKQEADLSIKKAKAIITVLEAKELQGKMHRAEDVEAAFTDLVFTIRGMLLALPGRLAVDVVNAGSSAEAAVIIRDEVYNVLSELANYKYDPAVFEKKVRERRNWDDLDDKNE